MSQYQEEARLLLTLLAAHQEPSFATWQQTVPFKFYQEIFRLNNWDLTIGQITAKKGMLIRWTNVYIFKRLPKATIDEMANYGPENPSAAAIASTVNKQIDMVLGKMKDLTEWKTFVKLFRKEFGEVPFHYTPSEELAQVENRSFAENLTRILRAGKPK